MRLEDPTRRRLLLGAAATLGSAMLGACERPTLPEHDVTAVGLAAKGLDFPGSRGTRSTMRFRFRKPLPIYPATYVWRALPRRQPGYYTAFFWGNDDDRGNLSTFLSGPGGSAPAYYGAHPYPDEPPDGSTHHWEIAVERGDFVNGAVEYDRWHTQAFRAWIDVLGRKRHEFYWDLPYVDPEHLVARASPPGWGLRMPPAPALTWGDAPWNPGKEVWYGVLRGIQIYAADLSLADIIREIAAPMSTTAGMQSVWYLNLDPIPTDIQDRSGSGHHPEWIGRERPAAWSAS
jgi:hypothetical protein